MFFTHFNINGIDDCPERNTMWRNAVFALFRINGILRREKIGVTRSALSQEEEEGGDGTGGGCKGRTSSETQPRLRMAA